MRWTRGTGATGIYSRRRSAVLFLRTDPLQSRCHVPLSHCPSTSHVKEDPLFPKFSYRIILHEHRKTGYVSSPSPSPRRRSPPEFTRRPYQSVSSQMSKTQTGSRVCGSKKAVGNGRRAASRLAAAIRHSAGVSVDSAWIHGSGLGAG